MIFQGHFYFSDVNSLESCQHDVPKSTWINLVRDPVDRSAQLYYESVFSAILRTLLRR